MMEPVLSLEQCQALWSKRDFLNHMPAGAGDITWERSKNPGLFVFWDTTKTNQSESESEFEFESESESESLLSQVVVSEAEFARPQPPSIQHKIKSLLLDMKIDSENRILVQFWAPIRTASGQIMLTTSHQPFGIGDSLYEGLCRFRKYCAEHQYGVSVEDTTRLGPPGRVFTLGSPEFCENVEYYSHKEFPLKEQALYCGIQSYAALPLFKRDGQCCVGVLELSSLDVRFFGHAKVLPPLEKYDLGHRCKWDKTPPSFTQETRQTIHSLAQFVKEKHRLLLVQVWVPCLCHIAPHATSSGQYDAHNCCSSSNPASPSPITRLFRDYSSGFSMADIVARLEPCWVRKDTSLVGRAYSQNKPCFVRNFHQFKTFDYPLVHVIRGYGRAPWFAFPLQLIHPQFDPFVLEVFLPRKGICGGNLEAMLESLLFSLKEKCSEDQVQVEKFSVKLSYWDNDNIAYFDVYQNGSSDAFAPKRQDSRLNDHPNTTGEIAMASCSRGVEVSPNAAEADRIQINGSTDSTARKRDYSRLNDHLNATGDKAKTCCSREVQVGVPPNAAEPEITLGDIKQYFGLKLNNAADELGVSRELGIKKWPSHKRKNVYGIQSSPRSPARFVEVIQESEIEPPCPNNNQSERDAAAPDTIPKIAKGNNIAAQDEMDLDHSYTMIVKATYKDDTVRFPLGSNSGIEELRRELDERFEFEAERFKIKYEDEGDWILLSCDKDLRFRMDDLKSSGQTTMHVLIFPATLLINHDDNFC